MLQGEYIKNLLEAGCDEAGRGCLAGPVFAAAVILPEGFSNEVLDDSKKLSESHRYQLREIITGQALSWAVASVNNCEIDRINIRNASILAMHRAIEKLSVKPQHLIIDGNYFVPFMGIPYQTIIKGDSKFMAIAAASVLAKTFRDDYMFELHSQHPDYRWDRNKGYPTREHRRAIQSFGITEYHRQTYQLLQAT